MMENSNQPCRKWYLAIAFMGFSRNAIFARVPHRQLDHKRYESVRFIMSRICKAIGHRDNLYKLEGIVEFDKCCFSAETGTQDKKNLERVSGSLKKINVVVMAGSKPLEDLESKKTSKCCRKFKIKVFERHLFRRLMRLLYKTLMKKVLCLVIKVQATLILQTA